MGVDFTALESLADDVLMYMAGHLQHKLFNYWNDFPPETMSEALITHCERAIAVIAEAWTNPPIVVDWEVDDYVAAIGKQLTGKFFQLNTMQKHTLSIQACAYCWKPLLK